MFGQALFKPLSALSGQTEVNKVPTLKLSIIRALAAAARCFPSIVAENMEGRSVHLLSWLELEVQRVTALTSLVSFTEAVTQASASEPISAGKIGDAKSIELILALVEACDQLLLHTAASLGPKVRQGFEDVLGQALVCLTKGLVYPQYQDRKMHRASEHCEFLRQSPELQVALLRLACTEVLCPSARPGRSSSNISLLKRVAEMALGHPTTSSEAARVLLVVNNLQHPSTLALPAIAPADVALSYINKVEEFNQKRKADLQRMKELDASAFGSPAEASKVTSKSAPTSSAPKKVESAVHNTSNAVDASAPISQSPQEATSGKSLKREREDKVESEAASETNKKVRADSPPRARPPVAWNDEEDEEDDLPDLE